MLLLLGRYMSQVAARLSPGYNGLLLEQSHDFIQTESNEFITQE